MHLGFTPFKDRQLSSSYLPLLSILFFLLSCSSAWVATNKLILHRLACCSWDTATSWQDTSLEVSQDSSCGRSSNDTAGDYFHSVLGKVVCFNHNLESPSSFSSQSFILLVSSCIFALQVCAGEWRITSDIMVSVCWAGTGAVGNSCFIFENTGPVAWSLVNFNYGTRDSLLSHVFA